MSDLWKEAIELTLVGLFIVFSVQTIIALIIGFMRASDEKWLAKEKADEEKMAEKEPTTDILTIVLISAVVAAVIGKKKHYIRKIKLIKRDKGEWALAGRQNIMGSHKLNKSGGQGR